MIVKDPNARIARAKKRSLFGDRWLYFFESGEYHTNAQWDERSYRRILDSQRHIPVCMGSIGAVTWWMFRDEFYYSDDVQTPQQVKAILLKMDLEHPLHQATKSLSVLEESASDPSSMDGSIPPACNAQLKWNPPNLEILDSRVEPNIDQQMIRNRVRTVEETLSDFGVQAKVVEVNQGPIIMQLIVEPGSSGQRSAHSDVLRAITISNRIAELQHDLELALAAAPVHIEQLAGRSAVNIEVHNPQRDVVNLRSVIESEAFGSIDSRLRIALGQDMAGRPVCADIARMPHLLIAGATGSGKSICIHAIIASLLYGATPAEVRFVMIDTKRVELIGYNGIPHLIRPVVIDVEGASPVLQDAVHEIDRRLKLFSEKGTRNIETYNRTFEDQPSKKLPFLVLIVDEMAEMMTAASDVEQAIVLLAQGGRAAGIHLVLATQRPSADVVTGLMKAHFPARISFSVTSLADSRLLLDEPGAEKLLGRGDMLYLASDSSRLQRLQGCYVSDRELDRLVTHWTAFLPPSSDRQRSPLPLGSIPRDLRNGGKSSEDHLLVQAVEVVRQSRMASVSFLQRKLRIGYSRAARLMDQLEAAGVVGPDEGPTKGRAVLVPEGAEPPVPGGQSKVLSRNQDASDEFCGFTEQEWQDRDK